MTADFTMRLRAQGITKMTALIRILDWIVRRFRLRVRVILE